MGTLALDVRRTVEAQGLGVFRFSGSFAAPTLDAARAALSRAASFAASLGPGRALLGGVDRRAKPDRLGRDAHLYALIVAGSLAEAKRVCDAATGTLASSHRGQQLDPLGYGSAATEEDYARCVAYAVKTWPRAAGPRDPDIDIRASGSLESVWARHRDAVLSGAPCKSCGHCGAALRDGHPRRRTRRGADGSPVAGYCSKSCRQKAHRRARRATLNSTSEASAPDQRKSAARASLDTLALEALEFHGADADPATLGAYVRRFASEASERDIERALRRALSTSAGTGCESPAAAERAFRGPTSPTPGAGPEAAR